MLKGDYVQCSSCAGIYQPIQADGLQYFHACPKTRVVDDGPVDAADPTKGRKLRNDPIPNPRNENVQIDQATKKAVPIADAGGAVPVTPDKLPALVL
jgi:hypothetical protein